MNSDKPINVFYAYTHVDRAFADRLRVCLEAFRDLGLIAGCDGREVAPGPDPAPDADRLLEQADIVVALFSTDFAASPYWRNTGGPRALQRHRAGDAVTVPVVARPVLGEMSEVQGLPALPTDGRSVTQWKNEDSAWRNIAFGLRRAIENRRARLSGAEPAAEESAADRAPPPPLPDTCEDLRDTAEKILNDQSSVDPVEALGLAKALKVHSLMGHARRILEHASGTWIEDAGLALKFRQQHALCTYKDAGLPARSRLDIALEILDEGGDLDKTGDPAGTVDQETLGLAGAVHKRKWELDRRGAHLSRALHYYLRGHALGAENDDGYTGINAAYILDLQAAAEERGIPGAPAAAALRARADAIREDLARILPDLPGRPGKEYLNEAWWFFATVGEALFGLGRHDDALHWLIDKPAAMKEPVPSWEYEATARQLAAIARCRLPPGRDSFRHLEASAAGAALTRFLRAHGAPGALTTSLGKVGLALSGGGFRASLYHIGVLAKLAELDVLRHVEVLSCVSGGSIIGAHYYLEVRELLRKFPDGEITREHYLELVDRIARDFLAGIQKNLRTRVVLNPLLTARMLFSESYSRTHRLGELFEKHIYARVPDGAGGERWLNDLYVEPNGAGPSFNPQTDNWRRRAKAPILVLNATTLNTGHNWQFTASWMGEPKNAMEPEVDSNERLRRMYYREAPDPYKRFRLGYAVAASACVPGLFEPLSLPDLYPDRTVRLVDGGVHDNQGIVGLLEQDCTVHLVSDASGQMGVDLKSTTSPVGVPLRTTSVLQARVRDAQYRELSALRDASVLRGFMFTHMKKDIGSRPIDWIKPAPANPPAEPIEPPTGYGILKPVQSALAAIRTDLDSFSDAEAFALMNSGYQMTAEAFPLANPDFPVADGPPFDWKFLKVKDIAPAMRDPDKHAPLQRLLEVGASRAFKVWKLVPALKYASWALGAAGLALAAWLTWRNWNETLLTVEDVVSWSSDLSSRPRC